MKRKLKNILWSLISAGGFTLLVLSLILAVIYLEQLIGGLITIGIIIFIMLFLIAYQVISIQNND